MTAIYYIHPETLSVNIRDFYKKYDTALKNLKSDVEDFVTTTKNVDSVTYVNKKLDIVGDGYYLKLSNKYPNRISVYEKTSRDVGYVFSNIVSEVKKILVFGLLELSSIPDDLEFNVKDTNTTTVMPRIELPYMEELRKKVQERFDKMTEDLA